MRNVKFEIDYLSQPAGSCLASFGETRVICTATVEESVPPFLKGAGTGWLTAEYAMLPGSTPGGRKRREIGKRDGRSTEIQRLIGRSLRAALSLERLGEISIYVDCDVIQADGGTRTASISGGWVALCVALTRIRDAYDLPAVGELVRGHLAAVSVGVVDGEVVCDLDYDHDSKAEVDMNVVRLGGQYVEIQGTGEKGVFDRDRLDELLRAADDGIDEVIEAQSRSLAERGIRLGLEKP